jgi:hypothetical protein
MRLGTGREGRDLLVTDMHPCDPALPADRVGQAVQAVADDAVDALDAGGREGLGELIGDGCHLSLPGRVRSRRRAGIRGANRSTPTPRFPVPQESGEQVTGFPFCPPGSTNTP